MMKKSAYVGAFLLFLFGVVSCEKDFTDIGTSVVDNNIFETKDTLLDVSISPIDLSAVSADGGIRFSGLGEYLLGVYKSNDGNGNIDNYKTIEASIVSQIGYLANLKVVDNTYGADTTVVTTMDRVYLKLPYQSTKIGDNDDGSPEFRIDSLLGNPDVEVSVNVYQNETFLNLLDPNDPTQQNGYQSDHVYAKGDLLSKTSDFTFKVRQNQETQDTMYVFNRNVRDGNPANDTFFKDTLKINNSAPFFTIPLDSSKIKSLFLDKYESAEFENADAFNNYFRGLIIEASGSDGSLIPFNFNTDTPTLEINYTNSVLANGVVIDTITKTNSFLLSGIRNSIYKSSPGNTPDAGTFVVQGTAGTMANIDILQGNQLQELANKNWLINDASLVFYIEQDKDTAYVPQQLFLYKNGANNPSAIKDLITEGANSFGGNLIKDENGYPDRYHFRITDYISDLLSKESTYNPPLALKLYNITDQLVSPTDTIVDSYNWNPRGITLHDNTSSNSDRKVQLKISYSVKK